MTDLDRLRRLPWYAAPLRVLGWFNRRKRTRLRRAADLIRWTTPVTVGVVRITYTNPDNTPSPGAMWELMEAPNGKRVAVFTDMTGRGFTQEQWGAYHLIVQWRAHLMDHYRNDDGTYWFSFPKVKHHG